MQGVAVQVAAEPARLSGWLETSRRRVDLGWAWARRLGAVVSERDRDLVGATARTHLVRPEQDVPGAGKDRSGQVGWRSPSLGNREVELVAAIPAAKARAG